MSETWGIAWTEALGAIRQQRLRSGLSALGVVIAVMAVVAMLAVAAGARHETLEQIAELGAASVIVRPLAVDAGDGHARRLSADDLEQLAGGVPGVSVVAGLKEVTGGVGAPARSSGIELLAVSPSYLELRGVTARQGRLLGTLDSELRARVAVVGADAARRLGSQGRLGAVLRVGAASFRVVGILAERPPPGRARAALVLHDPSQCVFVPLGSEPPASGSPDPGLAEIVLQVAPPGAVSAAAEVARRVMALAHPGGGGYQIVVPAELLSQLQRTRRLFNLVLGAIAIIAVLVGGIGIMNMLLAGVFERTREIGLRRAAGATRRAILGQFLLEAVVLALGGGMVGVIAGVAGARLIALLAGWRTLVSAWSVVLALTMAAAVGLAAGVLPARRAAGLDPIEALRHE